MHYAIKLVVGENLVQRRAIADIDFCELVTRIFCMRADVVTLDCGIVEIVEVVDYRDLFDVVGQQSIHEMGSDESCAAGYENPFHPFCPWLLSRINPQMPSPSRS